jgi:hypothetical protein
MQSGMQSGMQSVPCEFLFRGLPRADVDRLCALTRGVDKEVTAADARLKSRLQQAQAQAAEAAKRAASVQAAEAAKAAAATREVDAYRGLPAYMQTLTARMQAVTGALGAAAAALEQRSVPVQAPPLSQAAPQFQAPPPRQAQGWAKYQGNTKFPAAESDRELMLARRQDARYEAVRTTPALQNIAEAISQRPKGDALRNATGRVLREGVMTPGTIPIINRELEGQQRRQAEAAARPVYMDQLGECFQNPDEGQRKECILNVLKAVAEMAAPPDDNTVAAVKGVLSIITPNEDRAKVLLQAVLAASGQEFQQALKVLVNALSTETMDVDQDPVGNLFKLSLGNTVDQQLDAIVEFTNAAMWLFTHNMANVEYARVVQPKDFGAAKLFAMYLKNKLVQKFLGDGLNSFMSLINNNQAEAPRIEELLREKLSRMLPQYIEDVEFTAAANVPTDFLLETVGIVQQAFPADTRLQALQAQLQAQAQNMSVPIDEQKKTAPNPFAGLTPQVPAPFPPPPPSIPVAEPSIFTAAQLTPLQKEIVDYARATADFAPARKVEGNDVALTLYNEFVRNPKVFKNELLENEIPGLFEADANGRANMVQIIVNALDGRLLSRHHGNLIQYLTETQGDQAVKDAQRSLTHTNNEGLLHLATANVFRVDLIPRLASFKALVDTGLQMSVPLQPPEPARTIFSSQATLNPQEQQIVDFTFAADMAANNTDTPSEKWRLYKDYFKTNAVVRGMLTQKEQADVDALTDVQKADIFKRISVAIYFAPLDAYITNLGALVSTNGISVPDVLTSLNLVKALQQPGLAWDGLLDAAKATPFDVAAFLAQLQVLQAQAVAQQGALKATMEALNQPRAPEAPVQVVPYTPPSVPDDAPDTIKDYAAAAHFFYSGVTEAVLGNRGALMQFLSEHADYYAALSRLMADQYGELQQAITAQNYDAVKAVVRQIRQHLNGGELIAFIDELIDYVNPATTTAGERVGGVRALIKAVEGVGLTPDLKSFVDGAAMTPDQLVSDVQQWRRTKTTASMTPRHNQADIQENARKYIDAYTLAAGSLSDVNTYREDFQYYSFLKYHNHMFKDNVVFKVALDDMPGNLRGVIGDNQFVEARASAYRTVVEHIQTYLWKGALVKYLRSLVVYLGASPAPATLQHVRDSIRDAAKGVPILYSIISNGADTVNDLKEAIEGVMGVVRTPAWMLGTNEVLRDMQRRYMPSVPVQPREPVQPTGMFSLSGPLTLEGKEARDYALAAVFFLGNDPATNWDLFSKRLAEWRLLNPTNTVVDENLKSTDRTAVDEFRQKLKGRLLVDFLNNLAKWASGHFDAQKAADVQAALRMAHLDTPEFASIIEAQVTPEGLLAFQAQVVGALNGYAGVVRQRLQAAKSVAVDDGTQDLRFVINFGVAAWILFTSNYSPADKLSQLRKNVEGRTKFVQMMPVLESLGSAEDKVLSLQNIMQGALLAEYYDAAIRLADSQDMNIQRELLASLQNLVDVAVVPEELKTMVQRRQVDMAALKEQLEAAKKVAEDDDTIPF